MGKIKKGKRDLKIEETKKDNKNTIKHPRSLLLCLQKERFKKKTYVNQEPTVTMTVTSNNLLEKRSQYRLLQDIFVALVGQDLIIFLT